MSRNEHKRVKHGDLPGDISKQAKIRMREGDVPITISDYQEITAKAAKSYRKDLSKKGRTVQRRRDKRRIEEELNES